VACPRGSTTLRNASTSINECMVPPGWFVAAAPGGSGQMSKCPTTPEGSEQEGYFRAGCKGYAEATSSSGDGTDVCTKCGDGILSRAVDADESPDAAADSKVAASSAACCEYDRRWAGCVNTLRCLLACPCTGACLCCCLKLHCQTPPESK
jgi:hypothetical protein